MLVRMPRPLRGAVLSLRGTCRVLLVALLPVGAVLGCGEAEAGSLNLSWLDTSSGQAGFKIERKTGTTGTYTEIAQQAPGVTTYADSAVASGTTYCYRVRAYDNFGVSDYSDEACGALSGLDLEVSLTGTGTGTVISSPAGIDCGTDCSGTYGSGALVTLTATPASGAIFSGWSGGCTGTDPCTISGNRLVAVTASFAATPGPPTRSR